MIERIQITNFQLHDRLRIVFDSGITAIVGSSDTGKSAIIRALRWVTTNKPRGDGFIRDGAEFAGVSLYVDGSQITRKKGKQNLYAIRDSSGGKGQQFEAFGSEVPSQIASLLNLDDVNFQMQHEPPFWFSLTAGEVAKRLNEIVDLGLIDEVIGKIASRSRKLKSESEVVKERLDEAKDRKTELDFVPAMLMELKSVEQVSTRAVEKRTRTGHLAGFVGEGTEYRSEHKRCYRAAGAGRTVVCRGSELQESLGKIGKLSETIEKVKEAKKAAERTVPSIEDLTEKRQSIKEGLLGCIGLEGLISDIIKKQREIAESHDDMGEAILRLNEESEGICPVCGGKFSVGV